MSTGLCCRCRPLHGGLFSWGIEMGVAMESLFTAALGLQAPWEVESVDLNTAKHRIDCRRTK